MDMATVFNLETVLTLVICFVIVQWYVKPWLMELGPSVAGRREAGVSRAGALR